MSASPLFRTCSSDLGLFVDIKYLIGFMVIAVHIILKFMTTISSPYTVILNKTKTYNGNLSGSLSL